MFPSGRSSSTSVKSLDSGRGNSPQLHDNLDGFSIRSFTPDLARSARGSQLSLASNTSKKSKKKRPFGLLFRTKKVGNIVDPPQQEVKTSKSKNPFRKQSKQTKSNKVDAATSAPPTPFVYAPDSGQVNPDEIVEVKEKDLVDDSEQISIVQEPYLSEILAATQTDTPEQKDESESPDEPFEPGKRERLYKVLVVGELGTGKTSIIKRYVHQSFSQHYKATIGIDFALKVLQWDPETVVRLQLWDIAGQERFGCMTRVYYKEAVGAFVVFDVTRGATLEAVHKWKADLDSKVVLPDGRPIPVVLLANMSDQPKEGLAANQDKMKELCQQEGFSACFETSAKEDINIDESANFLVSKILEMDKWTQELIGTDPDKNGMRVGSAKSNTMSFGGCAC